MTTLRISIIAAGIALFTSVSMVAAQENAGEMTYGKWCVACHMENPTAPGWVKLGVKKGPEFAAITKSPAMNREYIKIIVRNGLGSMPGIRRSEISDDNLDALAEFIVTQSETFNSGTAEGNQP